MKRFAVLLGLFLVGCGGGGDGGGSGGSGGGSGGTGGGDGGGTGGAGAAGGACDIFKNSGCPASQVCGLSPSNTQVCDGAPTKKGTRGDSCTRNGTSDDCAGGFFCATVNKTETTGLYCQKACQTSADCPKGSKCQLTVYHDGQSWKACSDTCSAWSQNTCQSGENCTWTPADGAVCQAPGSKDEGADCAAANDCKVGLICFQGKCRQGCNPGGGTCSTTTPCKTGKCQQPSGSDINKEDPCLGVCL